MNTQELEHKAAEVRATVIRTIAKAKKGHIGGSMSAADILVCLYHGGILRQKPDDPDWPDRDRLILSKGHSGTALLAALSDLGYFPPESLESFNQNDSRFGNNPDETIPGIEVHTGSLGHGVGLASGVALGAKLDGADRLTVALVSDGECYEGSTWEAFMFAAHHQLKNLVVIVDRNRQCCEDFTEECLRLEPFPEKLQAFGWETRVIDGHSIEELMTTLGSLRERESDKPLIIFANTIKGKGVSFMEGVTRWHHSVPNKDEAIQALQELQPQC